MTKDKPQKNIKPQTLKGFRDFLPAEMRVRNYVLGVFRDVFESFGFEPLETPSLEYASTLMGKYGGEADRLVYSFTDRGDREVAMPYDLTVPTARVLASYQNKIPLPFKRYQIQRVWRAEKPQKGRYREILQCDIDTFGISSPLADAEIVAVTYTILKKLGFGKFTININSRQILSSLLQEMETEVGSRFKNFEKEFFRIVDKLDKQTKEKVAAEFKEKGFVVDLNLWLDKLEREAKPDRNLEQIIDLAKQLGVNEKNLKFVPTLVRGLDYYTGAIFEATVEEPKIGSITGGGRYDNLVAQLGGPETPAVGTTIGLDRICDAISELGLLEEKLQPPTQVLITIFSPEYQANSLELATKLRAEGIRTETYLDPEAKLDKQLKYADKKGIPLVVILGPEEVEKGVITLRNMETGEQKTGTLDKLLQRNDEFLITNI